MTGHIKSCRWASGALKPPDYFLKSRPLLSAVPGQRSEAPCGARLGTACSIQPHGPRERAFPSRIRAVFFCRLRGLFLVINFAGLGLPGYAVHVGKHCI